MGKHNRAVNEYETAVHLSQGNRSEYGRYWMWLSGFWVCYVITALHWLLRTMKQNDAQYNRRNHRCCKPCLCQVPTLWQCSRQDDGHRSCSVWSCISSTQPQGGSCDPSRISTGLYRTRPCLPLRQKGTWCIEGIHEWYPVSSSSCAEPLPPRRIVLNNTSASRCYKWTPFRRRRIFLFFSFDSFLCGFTINFLQTATEWTFVNHWHPLSTHSTMSRSSNEVTSLLLSLSFISQSLSTLVNLCQPP